MTERSFRFQSFFHRRDMPFDGNNPTLLDGYGIRHEYRAFLRPDPPQPGWNAAGFSPKPYPDGGDYGRLAPVGKKLINPTRGAISSLAPSIWSITNTLRRRGSPDQGPVPEESPLAVLSLSALRTLRRYA